jgi:hypothetical protein
MLTLILTVLAPVGATIHLWRRPERRGTKRAREVYLLWWFGLALGVGSVVVAFVHVFDGAATAANIGFTRGDGGFQFENAMGDLAIGIVSLLCLRIRGTFWLAALVMSSVIYYGDAVGHVYQWLYYGNTKPGNIGLPLILDVIQPAVATGLYVLWRRAPSTVATLATG